MTRNGATRQSAERKEISETELLGYGVKDLVAQSRGPDRLSIKNDNMFLITDDVGNISPPGTSDLGLVWRDTRYLSEYELGVPGRIPTVLSSRVRNNSLTMVDLTFTGIGNEHEFETHYVHIRREQILENGFIERISVTNFYLEQVRFSLQLRFAADFADLFEMRGMGRRERGRYFEPVRLENGSLFAYEGRDGLIRQTSICFDPVPADLQECHAVYDLDIGPSERVELLVYITPLFEEHALPANPNFESAVSSMNARYNDWCGRSTSMHSDDEFLNAALNQNVIDFRSLIVQVEGRPVVSAGIPWYSVPFGRDSIIAALQTLSVQPEIAVETLRFLAAWQGTKEDRWSEEEPGKIMHEMRFGEMAKCGEIPHTPYYGTIDATPLFIVLMHETFNWLGDMALLEELLPHAEAAMEWIDNYGDIDDDGFLEYERRSEGGLVNQGWKDSYDAVIFPDGRLAEGPIALVEVQGYVYDAKFRLADIYYRLGRRKEANRLMQEAQWLRNRIDAAFWVEDTGFYALALDGDKRQVSTITSNPGHLLWSRVPNRLIARRMRDVLMNEDSFSGWGIRTLAKGQRPYNPISYHNGTVWPHDNALIAQGLCYYGFKGAAERIFNSLLDAGTSFRDRRLPELFCGMQRREDDFPVLYPVACDPQAWASGAYFQMLHGLLGLQPDANRNELRINDPHLPRRVQNLDYLRLQVGKACLGLRFSRHQGRTSAHLIDLENGPLKINLTFG